MSVQTDDPNRQNFVAIGGPEVDHFYGCWLDINQPTKNVLPVQVPAANVDGPFTNAVPIQQSIVRNLHQCLVAEIAFDPTPIPVGRIRLIGTSWRSATWRGVISGPLRR